MCLFRISKYRCQGVIIFLFSFLYSCGGGDNSTSPRGAYKMTINQEQNITFTDAKIKIIIYGSHNTVQDNSATVVSETIMNIEKLPSTILLSWPDNAYKLIDNPPVKSKENALYYFSISIDENNDGLLCSNDYRQDYSKTPFYTINSKPSGITDIYMTLQTNNTCYNF